MKRILLCFAFVLAFVAFPTRSISQEGGKVCKICPLLGVEFQESGVWLTEKYIESYTDQNMTIVAFYARPASENSHHIYMHKKIWEKVMPPHKVPPPGEEMKTTKLRKDKKANGYAVFNAKGKFLGVLR